jgi:hypothetical protein
MRGFLSKQWLVLAGSYYDKSNAKITNRNDGHKNRIRRANKAIYRMTEDIWEGRNEALHGHQQVAHDLVVPQKLVDISWRAASSIANQTPCLLLAVTTAKLPHTNPFCIFHIRHSYFPMAVLPPVTFEITFCFLIVVRNDSYHKHISLISRFC